MRAVLLCACCLVTGLAMLPAGPSDATEPATSSFLRAGEILEYRLGWRMFSASGVTRVATEPVRVKGEPRLRVQVVTKSRGLVDTVYPVTNNSSSLIEPATGRPLAITVVGRAGKRDTKSQTLFDYERNEARHTDSVRPVRSGTTPLPPEPAYDLMVAMLRIRAWNLKPGETRTVQVSGAGEFYPIEVAAIETARLKTPAGEFDTVVLEPHQTGEPKGFFKKGGALKIWVSSGARPQVVRFDTKTIAGWVSAELQREWIEESPVVEELPEDPTEKKP